MILSMFIGGDVWWTFIWVGWMSFVHCIPVVLFFFPEQYTDWSTMRWSSSWRWTNGFLMNALRCTKHRNSCESIWFSTCHDIHSIKFSTKRPRANKNLYSKLSNRKVTKVERMSQMMINTMKIDLQGYQWSLTIIWEQIVVPVGGFQWFQNCWWFLSF